MSVAAWIWRVVAVLPIAAHAVGLALVIAVIWGAFEIAGRSSRRSVDARLPEPETEIELDDPGTGPLASLKTLLAALGREATRLEESSPLLLGRLEKLETELKHARREHLRGLHPHL